MSHPIRRRAQANRELLEHVDRIADENVDAALRFIDAFEKALAHLSEHPASTKPRRACAQQFAIVKLAPSFASRSRTDGYTAYPSHTTMPR